MKINEAFSPARAIPHGWRGLQRAPIPVLVGAVLLMLSDLQCGFSTDFEDVWDPDLSALLGLFFLFGSLIALLRFLLGVFIRPGYLRMAAATLRGESPPFETIFSGGDRFWDMLLWYLLRSGVLLGTGFALCVPVIPFGVLGGVAGANDAESIGILLGVAIGFYLLLVALPAFIYVETGLYFGLYLVALENQGAMEALRTSWKETSGSRLWLLLYRALMGVFTVTGTFFFLIGGVVTWGITELGTVRAFLDWRAGHFNNATPSPPPTDPLDSPPPPTPANPPALPADQDGSSRGPGSNADEVAGSVPRPATELDAASDPDASVSPKGPGSTPN